ncbi:MAG: NAD-dependent epimerase/dehydratase family protein [Acidimicrobiia bacterium]|nr:NAD-dependent epimerase/dehydratase family protein [Acidimicrobiia bacterium]
MTVFVTGGSGIVGRSLVTRLVAEGSPVRALARSAEAAGDIRSLGAEPIMGDLSNVPALLSGMRGTGAVFHVAGLNAMCLADPTPLYRTNVDGTRNVLRAANAAEVPRLVYTSSAVVLGERQGEVGRETSPHRGFPLSHYERSKTLAEEVAFAEAGAVEVVAVNPSSVQGPGRATGTGKLILDVLNGDLSVMTNSNLSIVDIDDCTEGHLRAWRGGAGGERYVLSGFTMSTRAAISMLERVTGRKLSIRFVPAVAASVGASAASAYARMRRSRPRVCGEMVRVLLHGHTYDGSRATSELGLEYRKPEDTIRRTVEWFQSEGILR